jgi:prevent-host-death family protein
MREMSIRELRDSLSSIDEIVERDHEITLTRHGRPLAKIVALNPVRSAPSHAGLRAGMPRMAVSSEELVRADRDCTARTAS